MLQQATVLPPFVRQPRPRRILVIGGGVAGIAALRALVSEGGVREEDGEADGVSDNGRRCDRATPSTASVAAFDQVELIERRDKVGGVWYLDDEAVKLEKSFAQGTANDRWPIRANDKGEGEEGQGKKPPLWPSPAYPALRGNVLPTFLSFAGAEPFPPPASSKEAWQAHRSSAAAMTNGREQKTAMATAFDPFPTLAETHAYLEQTALPMRNHIRCNVECLGVWELPHPEDESQNQWAVRIRDWNADGAERTEYWDAVVLSVGWTDRPLYPNVEGMDKARRAGFVEHCKWYRGPEPYEPEQRIVVVGNGNSGNDVCAQVAARRTHGKHEPVYRICRHKAWFFYVSLPDPLIRDVPAMQSLHVVQTAEGKETLNVRLIDGQVIEHVDRVILAVGYEIGNFPFVNVLDGELSVEDVKALSHVSQSSGHSDWIPDPKSQAALWRSISAPPKGTTFDDEGHNPSRVSGLFWHFLHERAATLAVINLSVTSIPFWTSDFQSHCLRAIWDGSYPFPTSLEGRQTYERERLTFIRSLHEQKEENLRKADESHRKRQAELASKGQDVKDAKYEAPDHIFLVPYHVLGTIVADYLTSLRSIAVQGKPHWADRLPSFANVQKRHDGMYDLKFRTLEAKRAAARADPSSYAYEAQDGRKDVTV